MRFWQDWGINLAGKAVLMRLTFLQWPKVGRVRSFFSVTRDIIL